MEHTKTTFKHPGDLDSEIWEWLKEHGTEETKQIIMMTARHFAEWETVNLNTKKEQPEGLHFIPLNRLIQKIPSKNWNDTVNNYAKKLRDCLIKEGYLKDAKILQDYISYMNGNNVHMATMDEQEQLNGTFNSYDMAKTFAEGQYYVMEHPEKFGLCKPAEWSEGDKGMLNCIIATLCEKSHGGREANNKMVTWLENKLKSLRPANQKWNDDDEIWAHFILRELEKIKENSPEYSKHYARLIAWFTYRFKSLRPQKVQDKFDEAMHVADKFEEGYKAGVYDTKVKSWKPSEEQMRALENVIKCEVSAGLHVRAEIIQSLLNDLKKL